jgi:hypothetical protein
MNELKHSGLGIASLITSIVAAMLVFLVLLVAGVLEASSEGGIDEESPLAVAIGLSLLAFLGVALAALGMGIGGLLQKNRKKVCAVLGTVFSALTLVGTLSLMVLGFAMD